MEFSQSMDKGVLEGLAFAQPVRLFQYRPLDTSQRCVRLLRVNYSNGRVRGTLKHFSVRDAPAYRALSYTWGSEQAVAPMSLDGCAFYVRPNLSKFLQLFGARYANDWLWVDQICIDQDTVTERNHQVQLMSEIYLNAKEVIIWLAAQPGDSSCTKSCAARGHTKLLIERYGKPNEVLMCPVVLQMLTHPYWERLWIIQEVLLARERVLWHYKHVISWENLGHLYLEYLKGVGQLSWCISQSAKMQTKPLKLGYILRHSVHSFCQDPRDKVYAVQALLPETSRVKIDYGGMVGQVFIKAAAVMLFESRACLVNPGLTQLADAMQLSCQETRSRVSELVMELSWLTFEDQADDQNQWKQRLPEVLDHILDAEFDMWHWIQYMFPEVEEKQWATRFDILLPSREQREHAEEFVHQKGHRAKLMRDVLQ